VKPRGAIGLGRVHIGVLLDQGTHHRFITAHDRVRNIGAYGGMEGQRQ
jgi:hypothetical protein